MGVSPLVIGDASIAPPAVCLPSPPPPLPPPHAVPSYPMYRVPPSSPSSPPSLQSSAGASPAATGSQETAQRHSDLTTTAQALHANDRQHRIGDEAAAAAAATDQAEANFDRCGRTHLDEGGDGRNHSHSHGHSHSHADDSDGDVEDGAHSSGGAARALAPGPPPGPSGFSSPLARTGGVKQPLGLKVVLAWDCFGL